MVLLNNLSIAQIIISVAENDNTKVAYPKAENLVSGHVIIGGEEGILILPQDSIGNSSFRISCLGYESKTVTLSQTKDTFRIVLNETSKEVGGAVVMGRKVKWKTGTYGRKPKLQGNDFTGLGVETGLVFKAINGFDAAYIESVSIYVSELGSSSNKLRLHIYEYDTTLERVEKELTDSNIILAGSPGDWVTADLFSKRYPTTQYFVVTIERLPGHGNDNSARKYNSTIDEKHYYKTTRKGIKKTRISKRKKSRIDNRITNPIQYQGRVFGLTRNNGSEISCTRRTDNINNINWHYSRQTLVPMIFITYKYIETK